MHASVEVVAEVSKLVSDDFDAGMHDGDDELAAMCCLCFVVHQDGRLTDEVQGPHVASRRRT